MIVYFMVSIINSMAQSHLKNRYHEELANSKATTEEKVAKKD